MDLHLTKVSIQYLSILIVALTQVHNLFIVSSLSATLTIFAEPRSEISDLQKAL